MRNTALVHVPKPPAGASGSIAVALRFSGLQRGGHSIHYKIQLPGRGNG